MKESEVDFQKVRWDLIKASESERAFADSYTNFRENIEERFNQDFTEVSSSIYGDLEDQRPMVIDQNLDKQSLVLSYNLANVKGFLQYAEKLQITVEAKNHDMKKLFARLKFLGLFVEELDFANQKSSFMISGPFSVNSSSRAYGIKFSGVISIIKDFEKWSVDAYLKYKGESLRMFLDDSCPLRKPGIALRKTNYISEYIKCVIDTFQSKESPWAIEACGEMINFGGETYCFPELKLTRASRPEIYFEFFHKWSRTALLSRLKDLAFCKKNGVLLAVDSALLKDVDLDNYFEKDQSFQSLLFSFREIPSHSKMIKAIESFRL